MCKLIGIIALALIYLGRVLLRVCRNKGMIEIIANSKIVPGS